MKTLRTIELFAGCGGMALGMERAGFNHVMLNEKNRDAVQTLRANRPQWDISGRSIEDVEFSSFRDSIDVISGGFPCQSFSYAGKKLGFADTRGTLFFEFARAVQVIRPSFIVAENVKGLLRHDQGRTIETIRTVLTDMGYRVEISVLNALDYRVPQKRERLIIVGMREDCYHGPFVWPSPNIQRYTLEDALKSGLLFDTDVPDSLGATYSEKKRAVLDRVPPGGCWRDLPENIQREYMKGSFYLSGGKTGMARRIAWDEPSLTLTCSPSQNQTERCHPTETRPFTIREYARIQTFPDEWIFHGSLASQYKQIGNAVPVNFAHALGIAIKSYIQKGTSNGKA